MYSFKDLMIVDYKPGSDDQIKYAAQKRKRGAHDTSGTITAGTEAEIDEVLSTQARMKKKAQIRRLKTKLKVGRKRQAKRIASIDRLKKRSRRQARAAVLKKILRGKDKSDLSYGSRASYERMVNRKQALITRLARKLLPKTRAADRSKMKAK